MEAAPPDMVESGKAAMQKKCPDNPAYFTEWGKRMTVRIKIDYCVNVALRAYGKRFTDDELTELLAVASSQKAEKPGGCEIERNTRSIFRRNPIRTNLDGAAATLG
jgi:hypothetical protein